MRKKTREIRDFIFENLEAHSRDITSLLSDKFDISRQSAYNHLRKLREEGLIESQGKGRSVEYFLRDYVSESFEFSVANELEEDKLWRETCSPILRREATADNILRICNHGFTEMVNNVIDHSQANIAVITLRINARRITIRIFDDGIGIFRKIKEFFELDDIRQAMLELSKGKLTTMPERHSGEGIFFTSRMFDGFVLTSDEASLLGGAAREQWLIENEQSESTPGTLVEMNISRTQSRTTQEVFEQFASADDDFAFSKTHIPINLSKYEGEKLISRSQARRIIARADQFKEVILDFTGIEEIGQAFADEIFRVFARAHPDIEILPIRTSPDVQKMINRALARAREEN